MQIGPDGKPVNPGAKDQSYDEDAEKALDQSLDMVGSGLNRQISSASPESPITPDDQSFVDSPTSSPITSRTSDIADDKLDFHTPVIFLLPHLKNDVHTILTIFFQHFPSCIRESAQETLSKLEPFVGPTADPAKMREFIKTSADNAQATMYYIAGLYASGTSVNKLWATTLCAEVMKYHPDIAIDQTNCWTLMEAMSRFNELNNEESQQVLQFAADLSAKGYPIASWYMSLINLGCIEGMAIGDPNTGLDLLQTDVSQLQNPQKQRKQKLTPHIDDPLSFSILDRIPRQASIAPEPELKTTFQQISKQDDPDFRYLFLPWFFMNVQARQDLPINIETYQEALDGNCPALEFVSECLPVHKCLIQHHRQLAKHKANIHREMVETATNTSSRRPKQSYRIKKLNQDKLQQAMQELNDRSNSFTPNYREADKREAPKLLSKFDERIRSSDSDYFKALLHFHAGIFLQSQITSDLDRDVLAARHYINAGRIGDFVGLLSVCEDIFVSHQMYQEAADSASIFSQYCAREQDDEWAKEYRLRAELYQNRANELKELKARNTTEQNTKASTLKDSSPEASAPDSKQQKMIPSSSAVNMEWITPHQGAGKSKKRHKSAKKTSKGAPKKKHDATAPKAKTKQSAAASKPKTDIPSEVEPMQTDGATALSPDTVPEISPGRLTTPQHCLNKLSDYWNPEVTSILVTALTHRAEDHIENEGTALFDGIEQLARQPGVERLHEELAWHLMGLQRHPNLLLDSPEEEAEDQYKAASKIVLNAAEEHLNIVLSIKLGISVQTLPEKSDERQKIADHFSLNFQSPEDREMYLDGISYIMRSIGHVRKRRADVVERSGLQSSEGRAHEAYAQKRTTQTRQPRH